MTEATSEAIRTEAAAWFVRLRDGGGESDRASFIAWLEADPARATAYDAVEMADFELPIEAIPPASTVAAANDDEAVLGRGRRWPWAGTAMAAGVAAAIAIGFVAVPRFGQPSDRYAVATAPAEHRTVSLGQGSMAMLNGSSRLVLDRHNPRFAELAAGEATFSIRHDAEHPFVVVADGHRIQDAGTMFNLIHEHGSLRLEVMDGRVVFEPEDTALALARGQTLQVSGRRRLVDRRPVEEMAGWRAGRLVFRQASLKLVAADLARSLGEPVAVAPGLESSFFTGTIRIGDAVATLHEAAALAGLRAKHVGGRWVLEPRTHAPD